MSISGFFKSSHGEPLPIQRLGPILIKHSWTSQGPRTSKAGFDERHYVYCSQVRTGQL